MYRNFNINRQTEPKKGSIVLTGMTETRITLRRYMPGMEFIGVVTSDTYSAAPTEGGLSFRVEGF